MPQIEIISMPLPQNYTNSWKNHSCRLVSTFYQSKVLICNILYVDYFQGIPVLVLGNKNDLPNALDHDGMRDRLNLESIHDRDVACYSISCKNKTNIDVVLQVSFFWHS